MSDRPAFFSINERCYLIRPDARPQVVTVIDACWFSDMWRYEVKGDAHETPRNTTLWGECSLQKFTHIAADQSFTELLQSIQQPERVEG